MRSLAMQGVLTSDELALAATAVALAHWHAETRYCGRCGHATRMLEGGWKRDCAACGHAQFPRTDPVVIMLVTAADRCVLARQPAFPEGMMATLAGFLEPGETIETAVERETFEEIGIRTAAVHYHASQPWPFPHSLMIGCVAEAVEAPVPRPGLFHDMITAPPDEASHRTVADLGKLSLFSGVAQFPARVKCATLAWHALKAALTEGEGKAPKPVSTE